MSMSSDGKSNFGSVKWIVIIALGVVFGLILWTIGSSLLAEWQKNRRDRQAAQEKADFDRFIGEESRRGEAWREIINDAQFGEKAKNMIAGTAPWRRDGTLRSRIESSPEYKRRSDEIGADAMRKELLNELSFQKNLWEGILDTQTSKNSSDRGGEIQWFVDVTNLLKDLKAEKKGL